MKCIVNARGVKFESLEGPLAAYITSFSESVSDEGYTLDRSVIALWLGHESVETTQIYLEATLAMKEKALILAPHGKPGRYQPEDHFLGFLNNL